MAVLPSLVAYLMALFGLGPTDVEAPDLDAMDADDARDLLLLAADALPAACASLVVEAGSGSADVAPSQVLARVNAAAADAGYALPPAMAAVVDARAGALAGEDVLAPEGGGAVDDPASPTPPGEGPVVAGPAPAQAPASNIDAQPDEAAPAEAGPAGVDVPPSTAGAEDPDVTPQVGLGLDGRPSEEPATPPADEVAPVDDVAPVVVGVPPGAAVPPGEALPPGDPGAGVDFGAGQLPSPGEPTPQVVVPPGSGPQEEQVAASAEEDVSSLQDLLDRAAEEGGTAGVDLPPAPPPSGTDGGGGLTPEQIAELQQIVDDANDAVIDNLDG